MCFTGKEGSSEFLEHSKASLEYKEASLVWEEAGSSLYLGGHESSTDVRFLQEKGVTLVVNAARELNIGLSQTKALKFLAPNYAHQVGNQFFKLKKFCQVKL